jgi:hypothetical protein
MEQLGPRIRVAKAEPLDGYKARVTFSNNEVRVIDLEPYLDGPIFEPLRIDRAQFREMKVEGGTIAWDNGADIDPDVLYYALVPAWMVEAQKH